MELQIFTNNFNVMENDVKSIYDEIMEVEHDYFEIEYEKMDQKYIAFNLNQKEIMFNDCLIVEDTKKEIDMIKIISISFSNCIKIKLSLTKFNNHNNNCRNKSSDKHIFSNNIKYICKYYSRWRRKEKNKYHNLVFLSIYVFVLYKNMFCDFYVSSIKLIRNNSSLV